LWISSVESAVGLIKTILMQKPLGHGSMRTMVPDGTRQSPTNGEVCAWRVAEQRKSARSRTDASASGRWRIGLAANKRLARWRNNKPERNSRSVMAAIRGNRAGVMSPILHPTSQKRWMGHPANPLIAKDAMNGAPGEIRGFFAALRMTNKARATTEILATPE
jgi:hypothetical protein